MTAIGTIVALARRVLRQVFGPASWDRWIVLLTATFGLPLSDAELAVFEQLTGRTYAPSSAGLRIREAWFIIGRRAGKSMIAALVAVYLTCCREYELAPGERGVFMIIAADRRQARVVKRYVSGLLHVADVLTELVAHETNDAIELTNGLVIEIHTASFRSIRGYTVVGAVCDEIAFWPTDDSANPDTEILAALRPAMSTVPGALLVCITSPYAQRGETYQAYRKHFAKNDSRVLVAKAATEVMNPLVDASEIAAAYEQDPARAAAEYGAEFRSDIESFLSRKAIDACVAPGRLELPRVAGVNYRFFLDFAGGSGGDSATCAIAHTETRNDGPIEVLDLVREVRPPFSPDAVCREFAAIAKAYGVERALSDRWGGEFPIEHMRALGVVVEPSAKPKSDIYRELLPRVNSARVELLDHPRLLAQLAALERRTARGGRDAVDHPVNSNDDVCNAAAGALTMAAAGVDVCIW